MGGCGLINSIIAGCIIAAYVISLPVLYGKLTFGDGESWSCYASQDHGKDKPWLHGDTDVPHDYHDVSGNFEMLTMWGFINFMAPFGIGILALCGGLCSKDCSAGIGAALGILNAASYLAHMITMLVMRFRHAGRVCSGDFEPEFSFLGLGDEEIQPYLHKTGTWLFYAITTQLYAIAMVVSGTSFIAGCEH